MKKLIDIIKQRIKSLIQHGRIEQTQQTSTNNINELDGNRLLSDLVDLFNDSIKRMSIGKRMVYPTSFHIIMHKDDYNEFRTLLPVWTPEIIRTFYSTIKGQKDSYSDCRPISKKWVFRFSPCHLDSSINTNDNSLITVSKGNIVKTATLYNEDIDSVESITVERNVKVSIKCNNSKVIKTANLNFSALDGIEILDDGLFTYKFDERFLFSDMIDCKLQKIDQTQEPEIVEENKPLATISWILNNHTYTYTMKLSPIYISGKTDTRTTSNILKIDTSELKNGHVQIKCENERFFLCAFGETKLNEKTVTLSEPGNIQWVPLANNSSILMNGEIQVNFKGL